MTELIIMGIIAWVAGCCVYILSKAGNRKTVEQCITDCITGTIAMAVFVPVVICVVYYRYAMFSFFINNA